MTNNEAAELLNDIADRRLIIHVDGETKTMKQDYIDEALRLAIKALDIPNGGLNMDYISKDKAKDIISEFYGRSKEVDNTLAKIAARISEETAANVMEVKIYGIGVERCVCCGAIIPEGRMVCPICERR